MLLFCENWGIVNKGACILETNLFRTWNFTCIFYMRNKWTGVFRSLIDPLVTKLFPFLMTDSIYHFSLPSTLSVSLAFTARKICIRTKHSPTCAQFAVKVSLKSYLFTIYDQLSRVCLNTCIGLIRKKKKKKKKTIQEIKKNKYVWGIVTCYISIRHLSTRLAFEKLQTIAVHRNNKTILSVS